MKINSILTNNFKKLYNPLFFKKHKTSHKDNQKKGLKSINFFNLSTNINNNNQIIDTSNSEMNLNHIWGINKQADIDHFHKQAYITIDFLSNFLLTLDNGSILPNCKPNFLRNIIVNTSNANPVNEKEVFFELEHKILENFTKIAHNGYLSWFPCMTSYPGILGNLISYSFINPSSSNMKYPNHSKNQPYNQYSLSNLNPIIYKLERKITDWFREAYSLPEIFNTNQSGSLIYHGVSLTSISCALASRRRAILKYGIENIHKFRYYCSEGAHYSIKKGINICGSKAVAIPITLCSIKNNYIMNMKILKETIEKDVREGLIPIYIAATIGTTGTTGIDNIEEIGELSKKYSMWYHIDAAYAGNFLILEEYRSIMKGAELSNSFAFNPVKLFPVLQNSACCYYKNIEEAISAYELLDEINKDEIYRKDLNLNYFEFNTSRLNKSLKIYSSLLSIGKDNLKELTRRILNGAKRCEEILRKNEHFEILFPSKFGLVCFKLKSKGNEDLLNLIKRVNEKGKVFIGPIEIVDDNGETIIIVRLSVNWLYTNDITIDQNMNEIIITYNEMFK